jgi:hypothetical protein
MAKTEFHSEVRGLIRERANNRCEICGMTKYNMQIHHRRPRGMGGDGRATTNVVSNGLLLCAQCHRMVERERATAYDQGWLVHQSVEPWTVPVRRFDGWWLLRDSPPWLDPGWVGGQGEPVQVVDGRVGQPGALGVTSSPGGDGAPLQPEDVGHLVERQPTSSLLVDDAVDVTLDEPVGLSGEQPQQPDPVEGVRGGEDGVQQFPEQGA